MHVDLGLHYLHIFAYTVWYPCEWCGLIRMCIAVDKMLFFFVVVFQPENIDIFLISPQNICNGYSLEVLYCGTSNVYPSLCFCALLSHFR